MFSSLIFVSESFRQESGYLPLSGEEDHKVAAFARKPTKNTLATLYIDKSKDKAGSGTYPDQPRAHNLNRLVLGRSNVVDKWRMSDDGRERVAVDVGAPFPARRVGVAGAYIFRLKALELLLRAEFVGLRRKLVSVLQNKYRNSVKHIPWLVWFVSKADEMLL